MTRPKVLDGRTRNEICLTSRGGHSEFNYGRHTSTSETVRNINTYRGNAPNPLLSVGSEYNDPNESIFENYSNQKKRKQLEQDTQFQQELETTLLNLERNPGMKTKVWDRITSLHNQFEEEKGQQGLKAGETARKRLLRKEKSIEEAHNIGLDNLIL